MTFNVFAIISDGAVVTYPADIRREFPQISFPGTITEDTYLPLNCVPVLVDDEPPIDTFTYNVPKAPEFRDGAWRQGWARTLMTDEQIALLNVG